MEEVMGRNGVNAVLKLASQSSLIENYPADDTKLDFPFSTMGSLTETLEQVYGPHGGRGLVAPHRARLFQLRRASIWHADGADCRWRSDSCPCLPK